MNIFLIIIDSLRKDHLGCYGNRWIRTSNFDRFSEKSCTFESAYPESLPTISVRRALHTGIRTFPFRDYSPVKGDYIHILGWQPIPEKQETLSEILRKNGFRTGFITDTYHQFKPSMNFHRGFDEWRWIRGQEFDAFNSHPSNEADAYRFSSGKGNDNVLRRYLSNVGDRSAENDYFPARVFSSASRWMEQNMDSEEDLFLLVDCFDPHEPWDPPGSYVDMYDPHYHGKKLIMPLYKDWDTYLTPEELNNMKTLYASEVSLVDHWFGKFMRTIYDNGLWDETMILLLSDHGQQMGEHGPTGKVDRAMYPELMEIPLIIHIPGITEPGSRVSEMVYNLDATKTILSYLGLKESKGLDGVDLQPAIQDNPHKQRDHLTSAYNRYAWVTDGEWVLLCKMDGSERRLYDLRSDPAQMDNRAMDNPEKTQKLYQFLIDDAKGHIPEYVLKEPDCGKR